MEMDKGYIRMMKLLRQVKKGELHFTIGQDTECGHYLAILDLDDGETISSPHYDTVDEVKEDCNQLSDLVASYVGTTVTGRYYSGLN